eukprot:PITA_10350
MGNGKEKDGIPGFISIWRIETKVLMWVTVVMGIFLVAALFRGQENLLGKKITGSTSLEDDSNDSGYSVQIRKKDEALNHTTNPNIMHNSSTKNPTTKAIEQENIIKRVFRPYGSAPYLFIQMGAYRGGPATFAVVGLASKALHVFGKPRFECEWIPKNSSAARMKGEAYKMLPDEGYGRVYTVVVLSCFFSQSVGTDGKGGDLVVHAFNGNESEKPEKIVALKEEKGSYNGSVYSEAPPYDYLYCGSSLYGDLSPQRMREWMAYHAKFFGPRSHFVFHDAGGVHPQVRKVLEPWIRAGRVTLQDITEQEQYDGYYHNQFLVVNDCLHRYKFMANWTFFFDIDEYFYIFHGKSLRSVVNELSNYTQITFKQYTMSNKICLQNQHRPNSTDSREWEIEKLVFRYVKGRAKRDRKYAVQARKVSATGVHMSKNLKGRTQHRTEDKMMFYHYHNTINNRGEPCTEWVKPSMKNNVTWVGRTPYGYDGSMKAVAPLIKEFERNMIGSQLASTSL